jgi:hypothetical protein
MFLQADGTVLKMTYLGYRKLASGSKVYCLRAKKSSSRMQAESSAMRRGRCPAQDRPSNLSGSVDADGNFIFMWEPGRSAVQIYFKKHIMVSLIEDILGLKYPIGYDLR